VKAAEEEEQRKPREVEASSFHRILSRFGMISLFKINFLRPELGKLSWDAALFSHSEKEEKREVHSHGIVFLQLNDYKPRARDLVYAKGLTY